MHDTRNQVTVTLCNDFLISPVRLRSGEPLHVPLAAVERLLIRTFGNSPFDDLLTSPLPRLR